MITGYQLFSLIVLFQFGTTVIFGFAAGAGRDAWVTAGLSILLGAAIIALYAQITKWNGYVSLVSWYRRRFGEWIGVPLAWLYPLIFIYDGARILSDLTFLIPLTLLPKTPAWFFVAAFVVVVVYMLYSGIGALARIAGVLLPILILFTILEAILLLASGSLHLTYLQPVLGEGWGRVFGGLWPLGLTQTYGESIEMAVFWHMLRRRERLGGIVVSATLLAGGFIILFDVLAITALGEHLFQEMIFPAFTILKMSSVADFLENLDALGALFFMCTAFIKLSVHLLAAALCIRELTGASRQGAAIWTAALSAYALGITMSTNFMDHLKVGTESLPYTLWTPLFLVLPALALALSWAASRKKRKGAVS